MSYNEFLPVVAVASSLVPGLIIFFLGEESHRIRTFLNLAGALINILVVSWMLLEVARDQTFAVAFPLVAGLALKLEADPLSLLFVSLSAILWLLTTVYAIGYLEQTPNRSRFFGFFSLCVSATTGIALSANLFTLLIFYEILTLTTYPLVAHRGNPASIAAAKRYLTYTVSGSTILLLAVAWLRVLAGPLDFAEGGFLQEIALKEPDRLKIIFLMMMIGFGVKAGAFGIIRIVYDIYGVEVCRRLDILMPLAVAAAVTIVYGSLRALYQDELKLCLAYSTVSQVSYIVLGIGIAGPVATMGGIVHLVHQGLMKITLFFCAGNLAQELHIHKISDLDGAGRRMPVTMLLFTIAAFGMIGVPPLAGFISKWYLGMGALIAGHSWGIIILIISSLLNAAYFLPIVYAAWFKQSALPQIKPLNQAFETKLSLLTPPLITAVFVILCGVFANSPISPLTWARFITRMEYGP
jgi:formate hydrogenlyase subunit 3/multisubunit Na+/H+ antiporter MnhD subunit